MNISIDSPSSSKIMSSSVSDTFTDIMNEYKDESSRLTALLNSAKKGKKDGKVLQFSKEMQELKIDGREPLRKEIDIVRVIDADGKLISEEKLLTTNQPIIRSTIGGKNISDVSNLHKLTHDHLSKIEKCEHRSNLEKSLEHYLKTNELSEDSYILAINALDFCIDSLMSLYRGVMGGAKKIRNERFRIESKREYMITKEGSENEKNYKVTKEILKEINSVFFDTIAILKDTKKFLIKHKKDNDLVIVKLDVESEKQTKDHLRIAFSLLFYRLLSTINQCVAVLEHMMDKNYINRSDHHTHIEFTNIENETEKYIELYNEGNQNKNIFGPDFISVITNVLVSVNRKIVELWNRLATKIQ